MKKLVHSKTFWKAVIVGIVGVATVALTELNMVGYIAMISAVGDVILRIMTTEQVEI